MLALRCLVNQSRYEGLSILPSSSDELELMEIVVTLQEKLGLAPSGFRSVAWMGSFFPIDQCDLRRGRVFLSKYIRGVLKPAELAPIIASALVFHKRLIPLRKRRIRMFWKQLFLSIALILVGPGAMIYLNIILGNPFPEIVLGFGILVTWISTIWTYGVRYGRKLRLMADAFAAETVGRENFLTSLG